MHEYESWIIKKAERWRIHAFQLWFWRRLLRVPWTARRSNQSISPPNYLFIYFTLQYCIGFAIHWLESAMGVLVFSILNPPSTSLPIPSLWVTQCTNPEHPVLCIEPGLAIGFTYDNYMFQCHSPYHPSLSLSHRVQKTVLYVCVSFAVSHTGLSLPSF